MRFRRKRDKRIAAIDIAPLVDVVFLLLIFFMLTIGPPLKVNRVELPESSKGENPSLEQSVAISILADEIMIDGMQTKPGDLESIPKTQDIIILAQKNIPYFRVIEVLDVLRNSDHKRVSLATTAIID
ncbi:MAG: biopolymer transporter ExbD [Deltaproteobacteria bacterium]|nr:biopolymer transporter ExbD [Deltaproteobacteria bacterium]